MKTKGMKQNCIYNEEIKRNIYNKYRGSNLEVLEYLIEISPEDKRIKKLYNDYMEAESESDEALDIFWAAMNYIGIVDYIVECELS